MSMDFCAFGIHATERGGPSCTYIQREIPCTETWSPCTRRGSSSRGSPFTLYEESPNGSQELFFL